MLSDPFERRVSRHSAGSSDFSFLIVMIVASQYGSASQRNAQEQTEVLSTIKTSGGSSGHLELVELVELWWKQNPWPVPWFTKEHGPMDVS
jgi:hypothetical protein